MKRKIAFLGTAVAMALAAGTPASAQFDSALGITKSTQNETRSSQQRIERLDSETTALLGDYRANLKQFELSERFNKTRAAEIESQGNAIERLQEDLDNVETLQLAMLPLMEDMLNNLEAFVAADMPFNETERAERIARLRRVMADSEVSAAQRYRLIVEAYQIENEFGRTLESYKAEVDGLSVEFLRVGRLALIYKSADDSVLRIYDSEQGEFVDLPKSFLDDVRLGLRMAKRQTAPDLLEIPVPAPTAAQ